MAETRRRLRRDQRRRAVPRPQGRRHAATRSSSPASARPTPSCATAWKTDVFLFNVESEAELHALADVAQPLGKSAAGRPARQPRPAAQDARQDRYQRQGRQVRPGHRHRPRVRPAAWSATRTSASSACTCTSARRSSAPQPYREGVAKGLVLIDQLRRAGAPIEYLNMGGGFGIHYRKQEALPADAFAEVIVPAVQQARLPAGPGAGPVHRRQRRHPGQPGDLHQGVGRQALRHPGRRHERPDPADAVRFVPPHLAGRAGRRACPAPPEDYEADIPGTIKQDVVGPVCESGDFLAKDRRLPPRAARRPAGDLQRRRLRHVDEFQLQQPAARRRGARRWGGPPPDPPARDVSRIWCDRKSKCEG